MKAKKKTKKTINSRAKGAAGEREAAKFLSRYSLPDGTPVVARRMARNGQRGAADLEHNIPELHIEVKRNEDIDIGTVALRKAVDQANEYRQIGRSSCVLWRRCGCRWRISYRATPFPVITTDAHDYLTHWHNLRLRDGA